MAWFRVVTDSVSGLREATRLVEETAVAGEKMVLRTNVFGYDKKRLQALKALGYTLGTSLRGVVSLDGRRFDFHHLYEDLSSRYKVGIRRSYAKPGFYKAIEVEKAKAPKLKVRGYKPEDRPILDKFATHQNVIRRIGSGVFEGLYPWPRANMSGGSNRSRSFPLFVKTSSFGNPWDPLTFSALPRK